MLSVDDGVLNSEKSRRAYHSPAAGTSKSFRTSPVSFAAARYGARKSTALTQEDGRVLRQQQAHLVDVEVVLWLDEPPGIGDENPCENQLFLERRPLRIAVAISR